MDNSQTADYCSGFYSAHNGASSSQQQSDGTNFGTVQQSSGPVQQSSGPVQQSSGPDWNNICNQVQSLLVKSCGDLVYPDGTLTQAGQTAVGCIRNGVVLVD